MKPANGISPVVAIVLTLIVAACAIWLYTTGHPVWGTIFAIIAIDFAADAVLSLKTAK